MPKAKAKTFVVPFSGLLVIQAKDKQAAIRQAERMIESIDWERTFPDAMEVDSVELDKSLSYEER